MVALPASEALACVRVRSRSEGTHSDSSPCGRLETLSSTGLLTLRDARCRGCRWAGVIRLCLLPGASAGRRGVWRRRVLYAVLWRRVLSQLGVQGPS